MNIVMTETRPHLGVVHAADGVDRTKELMSIAGRYVPRLGTARERGIARVRRVDLVMRPIEIHAAVSLS